MTSHHLWRGVVIKGKKVLIFGNGGSAADVQHMVAELLDKFKLERNIIFGDGRKKIYDSELPVIKKLRKV
jgi:hypothetical protein